MSHVVRFFCRSIIFHWFFCGYKIHFRVINIKSFIFLGTVEGAQHFWLAFDKPNASKIRKFVSQNRPWRQGALIFQITNR